MDGIFKTYRSVYFYIAKLLKNRNVSNDFLLKNTDDLLAFGNETSIEPFDYSALRVASSRLVVLSFMDLDSIKSTSILSLLGLASDNEKEFQKDLIKSFKQEEEKLEEIKSYFIDCVNKFKRRINNSNLLTTPIPEKEIYKVIWDIAEIEDKTSKEGLLLDDLTSKRIQLKHKVTQGEDLNLRVITDFYSPITTSPFAFTMLEEYNDFLKPIVDDIIKYKHIYLLFELLVTFKVTNWMLTTIWRK